MRAQRAIKSWRRPSTLAMESSSSMRGARRYKALWPFLIAALASAAGEVGLAEPGRADDDDVVVALDKACLGEAEELRTVEASPVAEVDVLDDGVGAKLGLFQVALESAVVPLGELSVDEQAEALLEGEAPGTRVARAGR